MNQKDTNLNLQQNTKEVLNVYVAKIKQVENKVIPLSRQKYLDGINNALKKQQSYSVWKLLEYAIKNTFNLNFKDLDFKCVNGKWYCDKCYFSLSHTKDNVVVAVSDSLCGVDIEKAKKLENLNEKILTDAELENYKNLQKQGYISKKWVEKESIFKTLDKKIFIPNQIETKDFSTIVKEIEVEGEKFLLGVCSKNIDKLKLNINCKY